jgi:hypothetical protein
MASTDLVQLADVNTWLGFQGEDPVRDAQLQRLISQISQVVYNHCNRSFFLPKNVTETRNGNGRERLMLINWPVNQIISLYISGTMIPARVVTGAYPAPISSTGPVATVTGTPSPVGTSETAGYVLEDGEDDPPGNMQSILLSGYTFCRGRQNVVVQYQAGYTVFAEPHTVPTGLYLVTANAPSGPWGSDWSVTYASSGIPLTAVAASPSAGQYTVSSGIYTFSAADAGASVLISYGYVPADVSQVVMDWIQLRWAEKDRPGIVSKSLGGQETISFLNEDIPKFAELTLSNFRRVVTM